MERALVRQSGESNGARALSVRRLSPALKLQVASLLEQTASAFPAQELHPDTARMYQHGIETLVEEFGIERVQRVLELLLTRQKFFPHPSEVREELERMAKQEQQTSKFQADPNCKCSELQKGYTWTTDKDGDRVIGRCPCFKRWQGYVATEDRKTVAGGR